MGARGVRVALATAADQLCGHQRVDGRDVRAVRGAGRAPPARLAVGWLFCGFALCYGLSAACISLAMWQATAGGPNHWSSTLGWLGVFIWTPAVAVFFPLIVLLFPDGHLPGRRWRWLAGLAGTRQSPELRT